MESIPPQGRQWLKIAVLVIAIVVVGSGAWYSFSYFATKGTIDAFSDAVDITGTSPPADPGRAPATSEFVVQQRLVDAALPYLSDKNEENRAAFELELDNNNLTNLRGANYFKGRGFEFEATADMSAADALDWVHLQIFKADEAAKDGNLVAAEAIAAATSAGQEHGEIIDEFGDDTSNVSASFVTEQAPIFEVVDRGAVTANGRRYEIDHPGAKLYAFTVIDVDGSVLQFVLRFTPGSAGRDGAWAVLTTEKRGTITSVDVEQY